MLFGCSKGGLVQSSSILASSLVDIACHTISLYHSFSCRYSISYDISISSLKKVFVKINNRKSSRKGGNSLVR
jgi:hypothetical protein